MVCLCYVEDKQSLLSKEGTGRVAIHRLKNIHHCYTFEANYYGTKYPKRTKDGAKLDCMKDNHFSLHEMKEMGKAIAISVLNVELPNATSNSSSLLGDVAGIQIASKNMQKRLNEGRNKTSGN